MISGYVATGTVEFVLLMELCKVEWDEDGADIDGMIEEYTLANVMPGICSDLDCIATTTRVEPDQDGGWCHVCEQDTVKSIAVLAGLA